MALKNKTHPLSCYFFITYFVVLALCLRYVGFASLPDPLTTIFLLSTLLSYSAVYLLPAFLLTMLANRLFNQWGEKRQPSFLATPVVSILAVMTSSMTLLGLYADQQIYNLFGFHFNGFVINLITTPGGLSSMGGSNNTIMVYTLIAGGFIALQFILLLFCRYRQRPV